MSDERRYKSFEVVIQSSVTIYVYADNEAEARKRWRECMEDNPGYIEDLFYNAEVKSIRQEFCCADCKEDNN